MTIHGSPLTASSPPEVPLPNAPLVRVIARISFPSIVSIGKNEFIAPFQEALRSEYPVLRPEQTIVFAVPSVGSATPQTTWRFADVKGAWRVSLASDFVALETTAYVSRADFLDRLSKVVNALAEHINPQVMDRIGIRYIDRVTGEAVENLGRYVRSEVIGVIGTEAQYIQHALSESLFTMPDGKAQLLARWGRMPKGATVDPAALEPIGQPSWILDLDMFCSTSRPFSAESVVNEVRSYAERIYTFFRWVVKEEFLKLYGGQV